MTKTQRIIVYRYWRKKYLGEEMIKSVANEDLLFLIPNNVKRMYGLPVTRLPKGKRSKKAKYKRKRIILAYPIFEYIEKTIDEKLGSDYIEDHFNTYVDVNDLNIGDSNLYVNIDREKDLLISNFSKYIYQ